MKSTKTKGTVAQVKDASKTDGLNSRFGLIEQESFSGPLPSPEFLEAYNKIDPTFAERIIRMAEENNKASIEQDKESVRLFFNERKRGQILSFILSGLAFIAGIVLALLKLPSTAITAILVGITPIIVAAIKTTFSDKK